MTEDEVRELVVQELRDALPSWRVVEVATSMGAVGALASFIRVISPTHGLDGMSISGVEASEVIERVRNVERIWALALDRAGKKPVAWPSAGVGAEKVASVPTQAPVGYSPTGDPCPKCFALMLVRTGTCLTCQSCGETTGCA